MTIIDWADKHWIVGGLCALIFVSGIASLLGGFGRLVGGREDK